MSEDINALYEEIDRLRAENAQLKEDLVGMTAAAEALEQEVFDLERSSNE